jgi:hypothetical protein
VGNKAWTLELDWTGKKGFQEAEDEEWFSWITQEVSHVCIENFNAWDITHPFSACW